MLYKLAGYVFGCLAMPAIQVSWLANSAFFPGFLCWHSFLAAGYGCSVCWLAMLTDCLYKLAGYLFWPAISLCYLVRCLCLPAKLAEYHFPAGLICCLVHYSVSVQSGWLYMLRYYLISYASWLC
jgi:hypothetical protein